MGGCDSEEARNWYHILTTIILALDAGVFITATGKLQQFQLVADKSALSRHRDCRPQNDMAPLMCSAAIVCTATTNPRRYPQ